MNLTKDGERLKEYAENSQIDIFAQIDVSSESYWQSEDGGEPYMGKYGFDTPAELVDALSGYLDDEELVKIITVASFKNRSKRTEKANGAGGDDTKLPEYVYVF
jgi:hypothetical protein